MCLNETYSRGWAGKHLSDMFPIRNGLEQGYALSPLLFNFALQYAISRDQLNQDGLKSNSTHLVVVYADDVNISGRSVHTINKNIEALVVVSQEIELKVNACRTEYVVMSRDQNVGRSHSIMNDNSSFERVENFKYWEQL
jgi:hypothetical protein